MPPWWRIRQGQGRERVKRYRRRLTAQQKKERRHDNSRRLVCQHLSDSLCSLNRIGRKQPQCRLDRASLFFQHPIKLSTCSVWGIWCACIYTHVDVAQSLACLTNTASAKHCIYQTLHLPVLSSPIFLFYCPISWYWETLLTHQSEFLSATAFAVWCAIKLTLALLGLCPACA